MAFIDDNGTRQINRPGSKKPPLVLQPGSPALVGAQPVSPIAAAAGGAAPAANPYDYTTDAIYQQALGIYGESTSAHKADALRQLKQLAIDYGDPEFARSLGLDDATIAAAAQNPFSTLAHQKADAANKPRQLDEGINKGKGFYSSARSNQQSELARSLLENASNASRNAQGSAGSINSNLANALLGDKKELIGAGNQAANRFQTNLGDLPVGGAAAGTPPPLAAALGSQPATQAAASPLLTAAARSAMPTAPTALQPARKRPAAQKALAVHGGF